MPTNIITVKLPQLEAFVGTAENVDKIFLYDTSEGKLKQADVSQLPNNGGGGGSPVPAVTNPSPFMVFTSSPNYQYDAATNSVIISDVRLKNRTLYPVLTTQLGGGEFNPDMIVYNSTDPLDDTKGRLIINNFQLELGQHITLIVPGDASGADATYIQMQDDIALLKLIAAPFFATALGANGGKVFWGKPANEIPIGWQEYEAMRGRFPLAQNTADNDFKTLGSIGGNKDVKLIKENIPEFEFDQLLQANDVDRGSNPSKWSIDSINKGKIGTPDANMQKVKLMNPYRIVMWIEFVGI